jgi:hypothetical protein
MPGYLQLGKSSLPKKFSFYYETFLRVVHIRSISIGHADVIICSVALSSAGILLLGYFDAHSTYLSLSVC